MVTGKTKSGFKFSVNEKIIESWEFTKIVKEMASKDNNEQITGTVEFVETLLGDQEEALMEHLKGEDGIATTTDMVNECAEILTIIQEKNAEVKN